MRGGEAILWQKHTTVITAGGKHVNLKCVRYVATDSDKKRWERCRLFSSQFKKNTNTIIINKKRFFFVGYFLFIYFFYLLGGGGFSSSYVLQILVNPILCILNSQLILVHLRCIAYMVTLCFALCCRSIKTESTAHFSEWELFISLQYY